MNKLAQQTAAEVDEMLLKGFSIRKVSAACGVAKETVSTRRKKLRHRLETFNPKYDEDACHGHA